MRITTSHPDERIFAKVLERFYQAADARLIPREDAMIQAMLLWLGSDAKTEWLTDEEWGLLAPELERIRRESAPRSDTPSTGKEPDT